MSKTTVVYHRADYDGIFCREIARKFLPEAELIGWDFGDPPLRMALFEDGHTIYVMDLPVDRVFGFEFKGTDLLINGKKVGTIGDYKFENLIWIDHHKSAIDSHPTTIPGYRIDRVAACRLAWQYFNSDWHEIDKSRGDGQVYSVSKLPEKQAFTDRTVSEPLAVRLAGEYDVWDHRDNDADVAFQFGLDAQVSLDWPCLLGMSRSMSNAYRGETSEDNTWRIVEEGRVAMQCYAKRDADIMRSRSFKVKFEGLNFLALNTARCNSNSFAALDKPETGHDALLAFFWTGETWSVSMYHAAHRKDLDLSAIAVKYGGGGHRGACGFRAEKVSFLP